MRILWLKMGGLWPLNTGGRQRTFSMVSELARQHRVTLITTTGPTEDPRELARRLPDCERVLAVPFAASKQDSPEFVRSVISSWFSRYPADLWRWRPPSVRRLVTTELERWPVDVVVADFLCGAVNLPETRGVPVVLFEHNVEHLIWKRLADVERVWWRRLLLEIEWRKLRRCEACALRDARLTVAVSEDDRRRLKALVPDANITAVPTGVDTTYFTPERNDPVPGRLAFSGSMDWYPNEDAMTYWANVLLPRVRRRAPNVTLTIVGRNPSPTIKALGQVSGIHVTGTVDDVRPYLREASLYVVPLRVGGGTRLKIFEALAMGKPVLSTTVGAEGLGARPGRDLEIADGDAAFAGAVVALLDDAQKRAALGRAGRSLVEAHYAWPAVTRTFEEFLHSAAN